MLRVLYALTPSEVRVAAGLAEGRSLSDIAAEAGIQVTTVRNQLKSVFAKTSTPRQGELVAKLLGGLTRLGPPEASG